MNQKNSNAFCVDKQQVLTQIYELTPFIETDIADDTNLLELGLDSMAIMQLLNQWRNQGSCVTFVQLVEAPTLASWQRLLSQS